MCVFRTLAQYEEGCQVAELQPLDSQIVCVYADYCLIHGGSGENEVEYSALSRLSIHAGPQGGPRNRGYQHRRAAVPAFRDRKPPATWPRGGSATGECDESRMRLIFVVILNCIQPVYQMQENISQMEDIRLSDG